MNFKAIVAAAIIATAPLALTPAAAAKVIDQSDAGFTAAHTAQVAATPADVWKMLRTPDKWWSKDHSWSGDAANFWLDSQAGGCFCEKLPDTGAGVGSVQHARVLFSKPGQMLRLSGAFGPLQGEAVTGTLTIQIKETPTGSALRFDYVVGGYMRFTVADIAPAVDKVIGEQLTALANALGGALLSGREEKGAAAQAKPSVGKKPAPDEPDLGSVAADLAGDDETVSPE